MAESDKDKDSKSTETTETTEETEKTEGSGGDSDKGGKSQEQAEKVDSGDDWKTKARKHEDRAKVLQTQVEKLTSKVDEFESASKSESEKLTDRAAKAENEASTSKGEVARLRVALKKGLSETQAKRLIGESEEELEADADELLASFQKEDKSTEEESKDKDSEGEAKDDGTEEKSKDRRRPKERLKTGATGDTESSEETDPAKLAERVPRGF